MKGAKLLEVACGRIRLGYTGGVELSAVASTGEWLAEPPGEGTWWHTVGQHWLARPHRLNRTRDGVLRSDERTCRDGIFVPATELGGFWWSVPLVAPTLPTPYDKRKTAEVRP